MSDFEPVQSLSPTDIPYSLRDFLDKFPLPQLVKVQEGYYDALQQTTVSFDGVCNLLSLESVETVLFEGTDGEERRIPLDYPCTVERAAEERFQQQLSIQDLLESHSAAKFVRVIQSDPNFESLIKAGEKLKIDLRKKKPHDNFLPFRKVSDKEKKLWKVPGSCEVKFQGLWDGEELPLSKFVKKNKLPAFVTFVHNSTEGNNEEDEHKVKEKRIERTSRLVPTGVVKLKGILVDSFVTAATEANGVTSTFSFPKTLPISVVPVKMEAPGSPNIEPYSTFKEIHGEEYEDMSGFQAKISKSPHPKTAQFQGTREGSDKTLTIEQLELGRQRIRQGNTYSPPPSFKVRSKSMLEPRKGSDLLQRTVSNLELRTTDAIGEGEENIYEDLNFSSFTAEGKRKGGSLSRMERRRSDSSKDQVSAKTAQNLNNLLHELAQNVGKETISLQIRKTALASDKPSITMKTFGRRERTEETESVSGDVNARDAVVESQSARPVNQLLQTNVLQRSHVGRSSGDALPSLPIVQENCMEEKQQPPYRHVPSRNEADSLGRRSLNGDEIKDLPTYATVKGTFPETTQTDKGTNRKTHEQPSHASGFEKNGAANPIDLRKIRTKEDDPAPPIPPRPRQTGEALRPEMPLKAVSSADKVVGYKDHQPVSSANEESHSFHGQEQRERPVLSVRDGKPSSVSVPRPMVLPSAVSGSSQDRLNVRTTNEERSTTAVVVTGDTLSPGTQPGKSDLPDGPHKINEKTAESAFDIPEDLSTLRVAGVLQCLNALNMQQFQNMFKEQQVDGGMLVYLDEEALHSFGMDRFHRLKLLRFIAGWRPQL